MVEFAIKKQIKDYSYSLWNNILEIWVKDLNDNEFIVATVVDCENMEDYKLNNLALEILENLDYEIIGD